MPEHSLIEQLDNAVQDLLTNANVMPELDRTLESLVRIAALLRDLPREEFRARLKKDLSPASSVARVKPIPEGFQTLTPYIVVEQAAELIEFVRQAFEGEERFRSIGPAGGIHCEMKIGDSILLIGGGGKWKGTPKPTAIHLYVPNADEVYERALDAGAMSLSEPVDQFYGDREGAVRDLAGNFWYIATNKETGLAPEGLTAITPCLHPRQPGELIDFLKRGLGAEEMFVAQTPRGIIQHAKMKVGNSVIEIGPAHGPYQPMPTMFYMYVENAETVDALYDQAIGSGAVSISPPADQPYGDRNAGVRDPFGNEWYVATHVKDVG